MFSNFSLFTTNGPPASSPWTPETFLRTGFHLIHRLNLFSVLSKPPSHRRSQAGAFSIPHPLFSSLQFPCTVVFHFRLHYWRKNWEIKGFADGARTCACYLIMSQVLRGKKKSFWDQSCMKDLDFSCRGKREQKKKKSVCLKNSHKICKILKLKVLQCRGTSGRCEQARLGPLGTVLGWGLLSVTLTARSRCGWRELTLKIEMALGKTRK